jgi:small subunit ribosomal protein S9
MEAAKAPKTVKKSAPKVVSTTPVAHGVGRRKAAIARVWLRKGKGKNEIQVNGKPFDVYFDTEHMRLAATMPFRVYAAGSVYDVEANVHGGGLSAQADAVKLGVSRALLTLDADARELLRHNGLLTVDSRVKERKKFGRKAARRGFQFVKR